MKTTMPYPRYDICPECNSRVNLYEDSYTIVEDTVVLCKCGKQYTIRYILDYWNTYYKSHHEDLGTD